MHKIRSELEFIKNSSNIRYNNSSRALSGILDDIDDEYDR